MNIASPKPVWTGAVRPDFVPASDYLSPDFLRLEKDRMWPKVWQVACREEELKQVGDYVTYDINDDSVIVVRSGPGTISAYHNVCPHRGRRLTEGCGRTGKFHCKFHGWQWNLDGTNAEIVDQHDWGKLLAEGDVTLGPVHVGTWGGWVFVNMDENPEPLLDYLGEVPKRLDCYEPEKMRYKWYKSIIFPCNWKVALEAFNEAYHVQTTHRQLLTWIDDPTLSEAHGRHSMFWYPDTRPLGQGSRRLGPPRKDIRQPIIDYFQEMQETLNSQMREDEAVAIKDLTARVGPEASPFDVLSTVLQLSIESAMKTGAGHPNVTAEQMMHAGTDWHVFPNTIILPLPTNALCYRVRPYSNDPDQCYFEAYALERYAPGKEPPLKKEFTTDATDKRFWGLILTQDFENMGEVQRGMKSRHFKGARPNPHQEIAVGNFHRVIHEYVRSNAP